METIIGLLNESVSKWSDNIYLWEKTGSEYKGTTYIEVKRNVVRIAAGLLSIGLEHGDRVAILSEGRNAWITAELGILHTGACSVPLSVKLDATTDLKFRLLHSGTRMIFVSAIQAPKIAEIIESLPELKVIIYLDNNSVNHAENDKTTGVREISWEDLIMRGDAFLLSDKATLDKRIDSVKPDDLANISYTSGTTADPKGIMLTHKNYRANVNQALTLMDIPPSHRTLAIIPWDHSFAHTACLYCFMAKGASVASVQWGKSSMEAIRNVPVNIKEIKPHLMMSVPALTRNFKKNIEDGIAKKGWITKQLFYNALSVSYLCNSLGYDRGRGWRKLLKPIVSIYDKILFSKVRSVFGGEMEFFIGGGALLDIDVQRFFYAIGIPVCQGYGLSEASPIISSNSLKNIKMGTSGKLVKFLDIKICDEDGKELTKGVSGEIIIRGDNVMKGYWKNQKATEEVLIDGWLHTGDMGYLDEDDYLVVEGRFKSLLIGNDGEKYSPEGIEETITERSAFISQIILHNDQKAYTTGLIVPTISAINQFLEKESLTPGSTEATDKILKLIKSEIQCFFKGGKYAGLFPERWLPSAIVVLPEAFTEQNHLMNSMLKLKRGKIEKKYASEIEFLNKPDARDILNDLNRQNLNKWFDKTPVNSSPEKLK